MATHAELYALPLDPEWGILMNSVVIGTTKKAQTIVDATTPGADALSWAKATLRTPQAAGKDLIWYIIAKNSDLSTAAILGANDGVVETQVSGAVDALYGI